MRVIPSVPPWIVPLIVLALDKTTNCIVDGRVDPHSRLVNGHGLRLADGDPARSNIVAHAHTFAPALNIPDQIRVDPKH